MKAKSIKFRNDQEFLQYQSEIKKATLRVGKSDAEKVQWFLNFSQCDLESLSQGQVTDLGYEINSWIDMLVPSTVYPKKAVVCSTSRLDWMGRPRFHEKWELAEKFIIKQLINLPIPMECPPLDKIKDLQKYASAIVEELKRGTVQIVLPLIKFTIIRNDKNKPVVTVTITDYPWEQFYNKIGHFLITEASGFRSCPECEKIFFADRKNKMYCSPRCQTTVATRKFRKGSRESKNIKGKAKE